MKNKPIILVAGEPKSIFFEIFFKAIKNKRYKSPLILICCKKILLQHIRKCKFKKTLKLIDINKIKNININNDSINLINIELKKQTNKKFQLEITRRYIDETFNVAFKLIKSGLTNKFINGPINKKNFLNKKFTGVTEYISENFKKKK